MVKIIFNDKTEINTEKNGNNFITDTKPTIPEDLTNVDIIEGDVVTTIQHAQFVECYPLDNRYYFTFIEISEMDLWKADIEDALCELSQE